MKRFVRAFSFAIALSALASAQEVCPPIELPGRDVATPERHAFYASLIRDYGAGSCQNDTWVIGLRGLAPDGKRRQSNANAGAYGDTLVVVRPDGIVEEFQAATHAGQERSPNCPFGVAQIRPGQYVASPAGGRDSRIAWSLLTPDGNDSLPAWLDRDGNGVICDAEKDLDEHYGTKAKGMEFRHGGDAIRPVSVGEQTLPPSEFERFAAAVGRKEQFQYLLIDANRPVKEEARDLRSLATPLSPVDDFRFYEKLALSRGIEPGFSALVVVLRGLSPNGDRHSSQDNVGPYNDTFLILSRYANGGGRVRAFLGSSRAGQASTTRSPGCYAGIAQVRPGRYFARSNDIYNGLWSWHVVRHEGDHAGRVPAWRDRDKDGYISDGEKWAAEQQGVTANEILIHNGIDSDVGNSIGCLTMPPDIMEQFIEHVGEGSSFPLLLLDANAALTP